MLVLRRSNDHQGLEWENSKHPNGKRPEQVVDHAGTITRTVGRSMKIHWFVQLIFFLFVCIFSYVDTRYTCILSYFDIKCTCIVHTCHIVCSDTRYTILCCLNTRIALFIMQPPVTTVRPVKQGAVHMYIRMLSIFVCVYISYLT